MMQELLPTNTVVFVCDIQDKMGVAIHEYSAVVGTAIKMVKMAKILGVPVLLTEQNPKGLGATNPELRLSAESLGDLYLGVFEKKQFRMMTAEVQSALDDSPVTKDVKNVILCGMEAHICVLQTTIDLVQRGYSVYILADGVSSCNKEEVAISLAMAKQVGGLVTTSECVGFRLLGSAESPVFKTFAAFIREEKDATKNRLQRLCSL